MKLARPIDKTHLQLSQVSKSFLREGHPLPVLDRISLTVNPEELVALVGPSGCGKTTLLQIVSGLVIPDAGEIFLNDARVSDGRGPVAYMQQKDLLLPWRKALANTLLGPEIAGEDLTIAEEEAHRLFEEFGLVGFEKVYPAELSGGMRQRVALIRTLLCRKSLLLLDEPFGALDAFTRRQMHDWLLRAWQEFRFTALFVTHDVEEALLLADRVYVLSARPAQVKAAIEVKLARPRVPTEREFVGQKAQLLTWLNQEPEEEG
ncbi:ABC transporter ATP-binding protein [Candidatus Acetothermia bacterium]|nr:ABC transporter ATP-binding protein [Candidatus Acetothermia bacterium]